MMTEASSWLDKLVKQDFSWSNLTSFESLSGQNGESLQDFWRIGPTGLRLSDDQMKAAGELVEIEDVGLYHVVYASDEWFDEATQRQISKLRKTLWNRIDSLFDAGYHGIIQGISSLTELAMIAKICPRASFKWCKFPNDIEQLSARSQRSFQNCFFSGNVSADCRVLDSEFLGTIEFEHCFFDGSVWISNGSDRYCFLFTNCNSNYPIRLDRANLRKIEFSNMQTMSSIEIVDTGIGTDFYLKESVISSIEFIRSEFKEKLIISEVRLKDRIGVIDCDIRNRSDIDITAWPEPSLQYASMSGTTFHSDVSISGDIPPIQMFNNIRIEGKIYFEDMRIRDWQKKFELEVISLKPTHPEAVREDLHFLATEGGCRVLRALAETEGNVHLEQLWHRNEIIARRKTDDSDFWETLFSALYGFFADYGLSIWRPFAWLFGVMFAMSIVYALWVTGIRVSPIDWNLYGQALNFSAERMLPLGLFDDIGEFQQKILIEDKIAGWKAIGSRAIATLQSVFSVVLIYLGVMAIRRRFKIS
jgi:hypothetical protein